tara:strand:+ start:543 stop:821 length:279 start_codon:yes stop_codon:yes gene_type:complete
MPLLKQLLIKINQMKNKISEIVQCLTTTFISAVKRDNYLEKQYVTNEVLRVLHLNDITFMKHTHPALDLVFVNISKVCDLTVSNAWTYKLNN